MYIITAVSITDICYLFFFYSKTGFWSSYCQISTDLNKIVHNTLVGRLRPQSACGWLQAKPKRLCSFVIPVSCNEPQVLYRRWIAAISAANHQSGGEVGALSIDLRLTSVAYIGQKSRTNKPEEDSNWHRGSPRHTWLRHHSQGQKVKGQLAGAGAYYDGLPHSLLHVAYILPQKFAQTHVPWLCLWMLGSLELTLVINTSF